MATLLELSTIEANSTADPGDQAAKDLRAKVRLAVIKRAGVIMGTALPTSEPERGDALEALAWAQRVVESPTLAASAVFLLLLARAPANATPANITGLADTQIENVIDQILVRLVKGLHPGRR